MNILIIGGSTDIGKNLANFLLQKGHNVIISYYKHYEKMNNIEFVKCNIKNEIKIDSMIKYVLNKYGRIDILINMAAISHDSYFLDKTKKEFMEVLEVNLVGTFLCNQIYSKYINDGIIINISSTDGINTGSIYNIDYSASKAGIINMSKNIAQATNNKVLCICPNWIDSDSTRSMDQSYFKSELLRIGQSRLITIKEFCQSIDKIIKMNSQSGDIYKIDVKEDKLWIEKI